MENEFPPNSHSKKEVRPTRNALTTPEVKVVERITRNKVVQRKKPLRRKFFEAFRPEGDVGFVEHMLIDIMVPGIQDAVAEMFHSTIDNAFGGGGARRRRGGGRGGYTSYNRMSEGRRREPRDRDDDRGRSRGPSRRSSEVPELIFVTRVEAEEVLDSLIELASKYDVATMRDLLSLAGEPHNPTDEDWGWSEFRGARIHRLGRDGYLLDLPRPESLD